MAAAEQREDKRYERYFYQRMIRMSMRNQQLRETGPCD